MNKLKLSAILFTVFISLTLNMNAQMQPTDEAVKNLNPYPQTVEDLVRHVIYVEQKTDEAAFEVELIPGKMMEVDCNNHRLMGSFAEETVQGWGYTYHVFETEGQVAATMKMCHEPKELKFVAGQGLTVRYNSRLPIVVYLPKDYDLKYRIWTAGELETASQQ